MSYTTRQKSEYTLVEVHDREVGSLGRIHGCVVMNPHNNIPAQLLLDPLQNLDMSNMKQIEITIHVDHLLARVEGSSLWTTMSRL